MNLKNIRILALSLIVAGFGTACTDLGVQNFDSEIVEETEGGELSFDATELLSSMYTDRIGVMTNQANIYSLGVHTSDELLPPTRGVDWSDNGVWRSLHQHTWDPTHSYVTNAWNELNERVFFAQQILAASNATPEQIAQGKGLRAYFMWHVLDYWGQVPIREVTDGPDVLPRVLTAQEAVALIKQDLEDAIAALPVAGPSASRVEFSGDAARALLARVILNEEVYTGTAGDMNRIVGLANELEAGGYAFEANYFTNFTPEATSEIIWVSGAGSAQNRWMMGLHYNMNPSGWNGFTTLAEFYDKYETGDQRLSDGGPGTTGYTVDAADFGNEFDGFGKGFLIGQQYNDSGEPITDTRTGIPLSFTRDVPLAGAPTGTGIRHIKYHPRDNGLYILLRWSDVYLMKAEAIHRGAAGGGDTALGLINALRATRGANNLGAVTDADILDERGRELAWEGARRTDQIRFGTFLDAWAEKDASDGPHRVLFPIPAPAIASNPNLTQNDGY